MRDWQRRNSARRRATQERLYARCRELLASLKSVPCADCGVEYPPYVMDFDHRDPATKSFSTGTDMHGVSRERLLAEVAKCDVVCANCHRERTHGPKRLTRAS